MEGSSTSRWPVPWSASGRNIAMKLEALGQLVANSCDWLAPSVKGKAKGNHAGATGEGAGHGPRRSAR